MGSRRSIQGSSLLVIAACLAGCAQTPPLPAIDDGLLPVPNAMLDELFVAPNVSLANYKRVIVDPIEVDFKDGIIEVDVAGARREGYSKATDVSGFTVTFGSAVAPLTR